MSPRGQVKFGLIWRPVPLPWEPVHERTKRLLGNGSIPKGRDRWEGARREGSHWVECSVCPGTSTPESQEGDGKKNGEQNQHGLWPKAEWAVLAPWLGRFVVFLLRMTQMSFAIFPGELFVLLCDL